MSQPVPDPLQGVTPGAPTWALLILVYICTVVALAFLIAIESSWREYECIQLEPVSFRDHGLELNLILVGHGQKKHNDQAISQAGDVDLFAPLFQSPLQTSAGW